jgi:hypothetical protein
LQHTGSGETSQYSDRPDPPSSHETAGSVTRGDSSTIPSEISMNTKSTKSSIRTKSSMRTNSTKGSGLWTKPTKSRTRPSKAKNTDNSDQESDFFYPDKEHFKRREAKLKADAVGRQKAVKLEIERVMDPSLKTNALEHGKAIEEIIDQAMAPDKPKDGYEDYCKPQESTTSSQETDIQDKLKSKGEIDLEDIGLEHFTGARTSENPK